MPVNSEHSEYTKYSSRWKKCRVVIEGEEAVKDGGSAYLPKLGGQDGSEYTAYKDRAMFFGGTARTVQALVGMVFRKSPVITFPESKKELSDSISIEGNSLEVFSKEVIEEVFSVGRFGVLVDMPVGMDNPESIYVAGYTAESIINWKVELINGEQILTQVVLSEKRSDYSEDEFEPKTIDTLRVLSLVSTDSETEDGIVTTSVYKVQLYKKQEGTQSGASKEEWVKDGDEIVPSMRGAVLDRIPFIIMNVKDLSPRVSKPPVIDLANVNLSLYRTSADLEHGRHFTALPTAWVAGFPKNAELNIGSTVAWISDDANANAGFLEFTGQGLQALENAVKEKKELMAVLGARLLENEKSGVEAAETHRIRKSSESNIVATAAFTVEQGLNKVLEWYKEWSGISSSDISIEFNKDYVSMTLDPQLISQLMAGVQQGSISWDTFFHNMKQGEMYPEDLTKEDELGLIETGGPVKKTDDPLDLGSEDDDSSQGGSQASND